MQAANRWAGELHWLRVRRDGRVLEGAARRETRLQDDPLEIATHADRPVSYDDVSISLFIRYRFNI